MKDMKLKTKLILGFMIPIVLTIINVMIGNSTSKGIVKSDDQHTYLLYSTIFTTAIAALSVVIAIFIALALIRMIDKSISQLSNAAKQIAMGHVDIEMVKYNNDEFGELVDEYTKVIENIKYQAHVAEEVSNGNLTIAVNPKSPDDLLGNSLKKLVDDNYHALSNISDAGSQVTISSSQVASASQALAQ